MYLLIVFRILRGCYERVDFIKFIFLLVDVIIVRFGVLDILFLSLKMLYFIGLMLKLYNDDV